MANTPSQTSLFALAPIDGTDSPLQLTRHIIGISYYRGTAADCWAEGVFTVQWMWDNDVCLLTDLIFWVPSGCWSVWSIRMVSKTSIRLYGDYGNTHLQGRREPLVWTGCKIGKSIHIVENMGLLFSFSAWVCCHDNHQMMTQWMCRHGVASLRMTHAKWTHSWCLSLSHTHTHT